MKPIRKSAMRQKLIDKILTAPPLFLADVKVGDQVQGFEHWGCIPKNATRTVQSDALGIFLPCKKGKHYLDGQADESGVLVGMCRA